MWGILRELGLRKLPYGPNTQVVRDHSVPVLDVGTIEQIKAGRVIVHGGIDHFTDYGTVFADGTAVAVDAVVLGTGYRAGVDAFLVDWAAVCDASGGPSRSGTPSGVEGLYFCGMYVSPAGVLREIGLESRRLAVYISRPAPPPGRGRHQPKGRQSVFTSSQTNHGPSLPPGADGTRASRSW